MTDVLRPAPRGLKAAVEVFFLTHSAFFFRLLRTLWPIAPMPGGYVVTRYDDVREVFLNDQAFTVPYAANMRRILLETPFVLGMADTPAYRDQLAAMREVMRPEDIAGLAARAGTLARARIAAAPGEIEVVDFVRRVFFDTLCPYLGITPPGNDDLLLWVTRLFIFQLTYDGTDQGLYEDAAVMAPALREHVDALIDARAATPDQDDVLCRCLSAGYDKTLIRTLLIGCLVALPQAPMLVPNAVEVLLQRPDILAGAMAAAKAGDGAGDLPTLGRYLFEAVRFDPLAPGLLRVATADTSIAAGTAREQVIPAGKKVLAAFASAMRDARRVADPERFDITRPECDYFHFGYGLHRCFGEAINRQVLPVILQALLCQPITRAPGAAGHLTKRLFFADRLAVTWR